jgi:nitrate/TMAO reductase-like tetraheme cytochrome c subunit
VYGISLVVFLIAAGGYTGATQLENHNAFCASCHSQPETEYVQRIASTQVQDLATWHAQQQGTLCIQCHSGKGFFGRVWAPSVGTVDLMHWVTGTARQPAPLTQPIPDDACTKCHTTTTAENTFDKHYHAFLLRWQAIDPNAAGCATCHTSHPTDGDPTAMFLQVQHTEDVCNSCHAVLQG